MSINKEGKERNYIDKTPTIEPDQRMAPPRSKLDEILNNRLNKLQKYLTALGDGIITKESC